MNDQQFDAITRFLGRSINRRRLIGGGAVVVAGSMALPLFRETGQAQSNESDAVQVVEQFYEAVDAYQYADAYALLGNTRQAAHSAEEFEKGYSDTAFVELKTGNTSSVSGGTEVEVELTAWHNDGTIEAYTGSYTVGLEEGELRILIGSLEQVDPPANLPPLCAIDDLAFALGPWDAGAGSRMSNVIATNTADTTCVLGGSPRLTLTASNGDQLVSTSVVGSPPVAITVKPSETATAPLNVSNWCEPTDLNGVTLAIEVAGDKSSGTVDYSENSISFPPCLGQGQASSMSIRGWVAASD